MNFLTFDETMPRASQDTIFQSSLYQVDLHVVDDRFDRRLFAFVPRAIHLLPGIYQRRY